MAKLNRLLIVESPAKAKTIKKFLGAGYTVKASMGHVRDIPSKGRGQKRFGIDFDNRYTPVYEPIKGREKTLKEIAVAAKGMDEVYLAPDPDREGEAIAWHLKEALGLTEDKTFRVTFNAITKSAVQEAIAHPTKINMDLVNAQQGRRVLDRLVGFSLSPFLWKKITKGLSAGRVQSVAVRLVVEREKEIAAFKPEEFWRIAVDLVKEGTNQPFEASLVKWGGEKFALGSPCASNGESAHAIAAALENARYDITSVEKREVKGKPSPAFITSTLQQAASTWLHFGAQRTMRIAQQLYEGVEVDGNLTGLITYMRTDSTRIAPEALDQARAFIAQNYAPDYLPEKAQIYSSKKNAQDAHEAIRPANVFLTPESVRSALSPEQFRLYELIWRRFVSSQMNPARYQTTTVTIQADKGILEAKGRVVLFDGYTVLSMEATLRKAAEKEAEKEEEAEEGEDGEKKKEQMLPPLSEHDPLRKEAVRPSQHFTTPPPRYSEASLVKALEKEGIGRPSTYAPIVQTIQERGYVRLEQRRFHATELGIAVTDLLLANFEQIMDLAFTAKMENDLDEVEEGKVDWHQLVDDFYKPFEKQLEKAGTEAETLKGKPAPGGEKCPLCGGDMVIRYSARGAFLGCAAYPECKGIKPMPGEGAGDGEDGEPMEPVSCPKCGAPMIKKRSRFGDFLACSGYPGCTQTLPLTKDGKPVELPNIKMDCEKCGKEMVVKMGKNGPFLACSGYPDCKNTKHISRDGSIIHLPDLSGVACDKCGAPMIARMSRRGPFMACSAFPKCRNAKPMPGSEEERKAKEKAAKAAEKEAVEKMAGTARAARLAATAKMAVDEEADLAAELDADAGVEDGGDTSAKKKVAKKAAKKVAKKAAKKIAKKVTKKTAAKKTAAADDDVAPF